jgi:molybdate transport system permease protein
MRAVPTEARGIGYVPQSLGLLPHRTVWQQLIFAHHADEGVAAWWFDNLHLDGLQDRYLDELSGGQQQRVSLAQAFSRNPRLVLLDEPFSGLDAPVRDELRREVRRLQTDAGLSTVLVTHDPEEAALLADEVVVIAEGRVLQAGRLAAVFARPASPEVARVLGMHNLNGGRTISETAFSAGPLIIDADHGLAPGTEIVWCIRPEHVLLTTAGRHRAQVTDVAHLGAVTAITVRLADQMDLQVRAIKPAALAIGSECRLDLGPDDILVWPTVGVAVSAADVR